MLLLPVKRRRTHDKKEEKKNKIINELKKRYKRNLGGRL
jgi:soluble P-type ATPase